MAAEDPPVMPDFGAPLLRDWVRPEYPDEARKAKQEGRVQVEFVVEADGRITHETVVKSTQPVFESAALAAVRQWRFEPALEEGKPAACAMTVPVVFELAQWKRKQAPLRPPEQLMPVPQPVQPAKAQTGLDPEYPMELERQRLPGQVHMEFTVNAEGRVEQPRVLWASHPAFVEAALSALQRAAFLPARQGPLTKPSVLRYPVEFQSLGARPADILAANGLEIVPGQTFEVIPQPAVWVRPVYPFDRLLAGTEAVVRAEFTVDETGRIKDPVFEPAPGADFVAAVRAALEASVFKPAQGPQGPVPVRLRLIQPFTPVEREDEARLRANLQPGGPGVGGPAGLDRKLQPLWRGFPVYPRELAAQPTTGEAEIEFVIDRTGRARLPRILRATAEPFGWAAATAVSQWVFEPPTRNGAPADIKVRIPVGFKPTNP